MSDGPRPPPPRSGSPDSGLEQDACRSPSSSSSVLAFIPLVWRNDYIISLLVLMLLFSIMTQSWNLTIGMCGIWNFGQLAIIAIGGYATGLLTSSSAFRRGSAFPAAWSPADLAAVIMVLPSIRLRGIYASMLTFAFAEVVRLLIIADSSGFTGGPFGLAGVKGLFDCLSPSWSLRAYFWLTLVLTAAVMLLIHRMMNSPFGMGLVEPAGVRSASPSAWASTGACSSSWPTPSQV